MARRSTRRTARRSTRSSYTARGRATARRSYRSRAGVSRRSTRRTSGGLRTIRIEVVQPSVNEVARPAIGMKPAAAPRKAMF